MKLKRRAQWLTQESLIYLLLFLLVAFILYFGINYIVKRMLAAG